MHAAFLLNLFYRARGYQAMPEAGGLLDQDEVLMRELDLVAVEVEKAEKAERDEKERERSIRGR